MPKLSRVIRQTSKPTYGWTVTGNVLGRHHVVSLLIAQCTDKVRQPEIDTDATNGKVMLMETATGASDSVIRALPTGPNVNWPPPTQSVYWLVTRRQHLTA